MACFNSTNERSNYTRLCRAIIDLGSEVLRCILSRHVRPSELKRKLPNSEFNFKDLALIDKSSKKDNYEDFDISLLYRSIVVFCKQKLRDTLQERITPSGIIEAVQHCPALTDNPCTRLTANELNMFNDASIANSYDGIDDQLLHKLYIHLVDEKNDNIIYPTQPWGQTPNGNDVTLGDDIERIRIMRNKIVHIPTMDISDIEFNEHWADLERVLIRIDRCLNTTYKAKLAQIKSEIIDKSLIKRYYDETKNMLNNEREVDNAVTNVHHGHVYETCLEVDSCEDSEGQSKDESKTDHSEVELVMNDEAAQRNYFLVCQAVVFTCTSVLRDLLQKELPPHSLSQNSDSIATRLKLKVLQKTMLSDAESNGYRNFDISLMYALLRNFCPSIQKPTMGWGNMEQQNVNYNSVGDDIERIRMVRNQVYGHAKESQISKKEFVSIWTKLEGIMKRMDMRLNTLGKYHKELDDIKRSRADQSDLFPVVKNEIQKWEMFDDIEKTKFTDTTHSENNLCVDGSPEITAPDNILTSLSIHQKTPDGDPEFVELSLRYKCLVCNNVLRDAVQSNCGHRFCSMCAQSFFDSTILRCPANEEDCMDITITEIRPDISTRKEVRRLIVFCTYKNFGCPDQVQWKDLLNHEAACDFRPVECNFRKLGCLDTIPYKFFKTHVENCKYVAVNCKYCHVEVAKIRLKVHEDKLCRKYPLQCLYNCGIGQLPREEMQLHMDTCSNKPKNCVYISVGCTFKGTKEDLEKHLKTSTMHHINVVSTFATKLRGTINYVQNDVQTLQRDVGNVSQKLSAIILLSKDSVLETRTSKEHFKNLQLKMVTHTERLIRLEKNLGNCVEKSVMTTLSRDIKNIKDKLKKLEDRIVVLQRNSKENQRLGLQSSSFEKAIEKIKAHESKVAIQDVQLSELDLRFQILETANYDGVLMWKIRDYKRRKQEAITGRTLSLYSQPFYSSRFGYKFCGRVYLNGDGPGKGTHLSFFFVVMKGDFDALMPWPFQQHVTLSLLDQESRRSDITESFFPDADSNSFSRPTTEMNIATGCPLFISHRELETDRYCKDDTIFLKLTVDINGLVCPGKKIRA